MNTENLPLVTVICNCYNQELYVWEALESVAKQSYTNIELIVINNGSSDYSFDVIKNFFLQYPETVFINLPTTISHNKAFNLAFKKSKSFIKPKVRASLTSYTKVSVEKSIVAD